MGEKFPLVTHFVTRRQSSIGGMTHHTTSSTRLRTHLDQIADRLVELGTNAETHRLTELACAVRAVAPGAAAALVDQSGSEVSRMRAFAVASAAVLRLTSAEGSHLVDRFEQNSTIPAAA